MLKLRKKEREQGQEVLLVFAINTITVAVAGGLNTEASGAREEVDTASDFTLNPLETTGLKRISDISVC